MLPSTLLPLFSVLCQLPSDPDRRYYDVPYGAGGPMSCTSVKCCRVLQLWSQIVFSENIHIPPKRRVTCLAPRSASCSEYDYSISLFFSCCMSPSLSPFIQDSRIYPIRLLSTNIKENKSTSSMSKQQQQ